MHSLSEHFFADAFLDAVRQMRDTGVVNIETLVPLYQEHETMLHPQKSGMPDLNCLASLVGFGGIELFSPFIAERGVLFEPPAFHRAGETVFLRSPGSNHLHSALALRLAAFVELEKFQKVIAHLDDEDSKLRTLKSVWNLEATTLRNTLGEFTSAFLDLCSRPRNPVLLSAQRAPITVDESLLDMFLNDSPSIICAGAIGPLYNRLSPYVARHREKLQALSSDEYGSVSLVAAQDPLSVEERFDIETRDGITRSGDVILIRTEALDISTVDAELRPFVQALAATETRLVLTEEPERFFALLSRYSKVEGVGLFFEATLNAELSGVVSRGTFLALPRRRADVAGDVALSVPTLGIAPADTPSVEHAAPFINALHRAYLTTNCRALTHAAAFPQGDEQAATQQCVRLLSALA